MLRRKGTFDGHFVRERGINGASPVITDPRRVIDNLMNRSCGDHPQGKMSIPLVRAFDKLYV